VERRRDCSSLAGSRVGLARRCLCITPGIRCMLSIRGSGHLRKFIVITEFSNEECTYSSTVYSSTDYSTVEGDQSEPLRAGLHGHESGVSLNSFPSLRILPGSAAASMTAVARDSECPLPSHAHGLAHLSNPQHLLYSTVFYFLSSVQLPFGPRVQLSIMHVLDSYHPRRLKRSTLV
jgi:hypothetical protein